MSSLSGDEVLAKFFSLLIVLLLIGVIYGVQYYQEFVANKQNNVDFFLVMNGKYYIMTENCDDQIPLEVFDIWGGKTSGARLQINGRRETIGGSSEIKAEFCGQVREIASVWTLETGDSSRIHIRVHPGFRLFEPETLEFKEQGIFSMEFINLILSRYLTILFASLAMLLVYAAKGLEHARTKFDDTALLKTGNGAIAIRQNGFYVYIGMCMIGLVMRGTVGFRGGFGDLFWFGLLAFSSVHATRWVNDTFVMWGIRNDEELKRNNRAVAWVEAGMYGGTGFVMMSVIAMFSPLIAVLLYILTQVVFVTTFHCFRLLLKNRISVLWLLTRRPEFGDHNDIVGNVPMGYATAGFFGVTGAVVRGFLVSAGTKFDLQVASSSLVVSLFFIIVSILVSEKVFLEGQTYKQSILQRQEQLISRAVVSVVIVSILVSMLV